MAKGVLRAAMFAVMLCTPVAPALVAPALVAPALAAADAGAVRAAIQRGDVASVHRAHVSARALIYAQVREEGRAARRLERRAHRQGVRAGCREGAIARGLRGPARREAVQACVRWRV